MKREVTFLGIFIWLLSIGFFFYEYFLRIFLGTIASEFMADLNLTVEEFSLIGAAYYLTYGIMQIPVGILTERIKIRWILSSAAFICTLGVFWLSFATGFYSAFFSRLIIGFGSSFAFVCLLVLALSWFPKRYFGFLSGIALFLGAIGPMLAGAPLAYLSNFLDGNWRLILVFLGFSGVLLTICIAFFVKEKPLKKEDEIVFIRPHEPLIRKLIQLLKNRQAWLVVFAAGFIYVSIPLLAAYWGTTYLETRGFKKTNAAFIISMIWIGYAIGSPLVGKLSDSIKRRKPFLYIGSLAGVIITCTILFLPLNNYIFLLILFCLLGFISSPQALGYAIIVEHVPYFLNSVALGLNNTIVILFGAAIPFLASTLIQYNQPSSSVVLTQSDFMMGLILMPISFGIAAIISIFGIKETFCRQQHEIHKMPFYKASELL